MTTIIAFVLGMMFGGGFGIIMAAVLMATREEAEPQIIHCKGCKWRMPYEWMFSDTWKSKNINDYSEDEMGCRYCDMDMSGDDYCSKAERRTDEDN